MDIDAYATPDAGPIFEKAPKRGLLKSLIKNALVFGAKRFYWKPIKSVGKYGRVVFFDSAEPNTLLLTTVGEERFLVSSSDQSIGRDVYLYGGYDFEKFEKVLARLDKAFECKLLIDIGIDGAGPGFDLPTYCKARYGVPFIITEWNTGLEQTEAYRANYITNMLGQFYKNRKTHNIQSVMYYVLDSGDQTYGIMLNGTALNPSYNAFTSFVASNADT